MAASLRISDAPPGGWRYLIALGSNQRHHAHGAPKGVLAAAVCALTAAGMRVERVAPVIRSAPMGPSSRRYANGAVVLRCDLMPDALLVVLKRIEADFGRRGGRRWGSRVLDLDIVLWDGGLWRSGGRGVRSLSVPHPAFRGRAFVLFPARALAADWRDPVSSLSIKQLHARLTRRRPAPR